MLVSTPVILASTLGCKGASSELIFNLCKKVKTTVYLSGPFGKNYLNEQMFLDENIKVRYNEFIHPVYPSNNFLSYLSSLDLIMRHGKNAKEYIYN